MPQDNKTRAMIQQDYDERRRTEGLVRVSVWVPKKLKAELVAIAARMRFGKSKP